MNKGIERRKSKRIKHQSAILHNTNPSDFFYSGTMYNFSTGGVYFESNEDLLQGDVISVSIKEPPAQLPVKSGQYFDVLIKWARDLQGASYQVGYGAQVFKGFGESK